MVGSPQARSDLLSPRASLWIGSLTTVFLTTLGFLLIAEQRTELGAVLLALAALRAGLVVRHWQRLREPPPP